MLILNNPGLCPRCGLRHTHPKHKGCAALNQAEFAATPRPAKPAPALLPFKTPSRRADNNRRKGLLSRKPWR
ncbi:hypothetical protein [Methylomagnum ishizawai]|uniref:hypothetical protein n=1 Tax=Methylomagnum ishizawai TaxID=1760988 RepID=UPI001C328D5E|nr:hypothetical protein [Methylomagnum ishizawai]BBL73993.1 hypothetical protein MishRS11D_10910 [Methylomagnum ishizawai]